jgi:hypothetical protein
MPQPDEHRHSEGRRDRDDGRLVMLDLKRRCDGPEEGHSGAHREVDPARQDDERHPHADDDDLGDLRRDVAQILGREERVARAGVHGKDQPEQHERGGRAKGARLPELGELRGHPPCGSERKGAQGHSRRRRGFARCKQPSSPSIRYLAAQRFDKQSYALCALGELSPFAGFAAGRGRVARGRQRVGGAERGRERS